jgi:hypothetical protein
VYEVVEKCSAPRDRNIRSDERIRLTGVQAQKDCPCLLRRLVVWGYASVVLQNGSDLNRVRQKWVMMFP